MVNQTWEYPKRDSTTPWIWTLLLTLPRWSGWWRHPAVSGRRGSCQTLPPAWPHRLGTRSAPDPQLIKSTIMITLLAQSHVSIWATLFEQWSFVSVILCFSWSSQNTGCKHKYTSAEVLSFLVAFHGSLVVLNFLKQLTSLRRKQNQIEKKNDDNDTRGDDNMDNSNNDNGEKNYVNDNDNDDEECDNNGIKISTTKTQKR